jgi:hypothetical protein
MRIRKRAGQSSAGKSELSVPLFMTEGNDRVDTHGAASGQVASKEHDSEQQERNAYEGEGVKGPDAVQEASH